MWTKVPAEAQKVQLSPSPGCSDGSWSHCSLSFWLFYWVLGKGVSTGVKSSSLWILALQAPVQWLQTQDLTASTTWWWNGMLTVRPLDFWGFNETTHGECSARCNGKSVKFPPLPILVLSPWWSHEQLRAQLKNLNLRERVDWVCSWDHPPPGWGKVLSASCSLVTQLCPTLCNPMNCSPPDFLSPSLSPGLFSNSCPLNPQCHPTTSSSVVPFSSCLQSFPASGSFPMSQFFESGGPSIGASATRGHQLHGKERVEFQRLSPLPSNECHLIYPLGTKFGCG